MENFDNLNCVLCYRPYDWCRDDAQQPQPLTLSNISSCLKHIPPDINQIVNWSQNNSLCFCKNCSDKVQTLSKLNSELEEIQKKIDEVVNCIILYVRKERGHFVSQSNPVSVQGHVDIVPDVNYEKQKFEFRHQRNEISPNVCNDNDEIDWDDEVIISDENDGARSNEEEITKTIEDESTFDRKTKSSVESQLNSQIQCKEQKKPKSSLQNLLESTSGFECSTCHKRFSRYTILQKHDCGKPTVECETCGLSFSSSGVLKLHTRSHTGEKPYKCETCDKSFSIKANLKTHIQSTHSKEKAFECKICGKKFGYSVALNKHKLSHQKEAQFKCDVCSKSFKTVKLLKLHFVTHSTDTTHPYKCDLCDKTFVFPLAVTRHKNSVHLGQRPYQCDICGKSLVSGQSLKLHKMVHEGKKPFQCDQCGTNYLTLTQLKNHEWTHKEVGVYKCEICEKSYKNSHSLKIHTRYHNETKVQCEICGKSFSRCNMKGHIRSVHRKEKPFKCDICGKGFNSKNRRMTHDKKFCHICHKLVQYTRNGLAKTLLKHQVEVHTVNTTLYSSECGKKKTSSDEMSSENFDCEEDDTRNCLLFKVEVKKEDEFSEMEDY